MDSSGHSHDHHEPTMVSNTSATGSHTGVSHAAMGHDGEGNMHMKPYFHFDFGDTILIERLVIRNSADIAIACVVFFAIAVLYEALKRYREFMFRSHYRSRSYQISVISAAPDLNSPEVNGGSGSAEVPLEEVILFKIWSWAHAVQSVLHMLQVFISFTLMLAFMTFNVWICASIIAGAGLGYFIFCWRKISIVNPDEHCH